VTREVERRPFDGVAGEADERFWRSYGLAGRRERRDGWLEVEEAGAAARKWVDGVARPDTGRDAGSRATCR